MTDPVNLNTRRREQAAADALNEAAKRLIHAIAAMAKAQAHYDRVKNGD